MKIARDFRGGMTAKEVAAKHGIHQFTVYNIIKRVKQDAKLDCEVTPAPQKELEKIILESSTPSKGRLVDRILSLPITVQQKVDLLESL